MRIDAPEFAAENEADVKEPRFVIKIEYETDSLFITSHDDIPSVPGTVISNALVEPNLTSQLIKPDDAIAEIGSASFRLEDISTLFTQEVQERLADGAGLRSRIVEFYLGYRGLDFDNFRLTGTQRVNNADLSDGIYSVDCLDIQRSLRTDVFIPAETTLTTSVTATQNTIPLADASKFQLVFHGPSYSDAPSTSVGYIRIKKEIIRWTGKSGDTLTGCTRGVFGTTPEAYTVDGGDPPDQRERVLETIYLELPTLKLALAVLTGELYNDGQTLPDHWHLGIDPSLVNVDQFLDKPDLYDVTDDTQGLVLRFLEIGKIDGKRFLEKEVYLAAGVFSPVDVQGRLGILRMNRLIAAASTVLTIDPSNAVVASGITHDMEAVHNRFSVLWSYDADQRKFRRETLFVDADSFSVHGQAGVFRVEFKGLTSSRHTDAVILGILNMIRERYAGPPIIMSVELLHGLNRIEIGDVVRVRFPHLADFTSPFGFLDRAMEVQRVRCNHRTGKLTVDLFASTATALISAPGETPGSESALQDAFYSSAGTLLSSAPGITIVGNTITAATQPLVGTADVRASASIYYWLDDLTLAAGVNLVITANVQLRVRGFFTINGTINGVGNGHPGTADTGQSLAEVTDFGRKIFVQEMIPGTPGYVGNSKGQDGWLFKRTSASNNDTGLLHTRKVAKAISPNSSAPTLMLTSDGATLGGLPVDLRGAGGPPGGRIYGYDAFPLLRLFIPGVPPLNFPSPFPAQFRGGAGAAGGAGFLVICRGAGMGVNGGINLSGNNSAATTSVTVDTLSPDFTPLLASPATGYPGPGGAGGPGTMYLLLDGAGLSVPDFGNKFVGKTGIVPDNGTRIARRNSEVVAGLITEPISGHDIDDPVISNLDLSNACLRFQYIPGVQVAAGDPVSKPPAPTGLSATGVELGVELSVTTDLNRVDTVEIFASTANDRTTAGLVLEGRALTFRQQLPASNLRYYWARTRGPLDAQGKRAVSDFFPLSATAGVSATSLAGGAGADGESLQIQYSSDGITFHDPPYVAGDVFLRQRVGTSMAYSDPIRFVGEDGATGATGQTGNFIDLIFQRSATPPATPTGNMPVGWFQVPPASNGNPLYVSRGEKQSTGSLVGVWSTPAIIVEDGEPGVPGVQGPGLFTWALLTGNIVVTSDTAEKTGGTTGTTYDTAARSVQSYSQGCFVSANAGLNNAAAAFGITTDPTVDANHTSIDFCWRLAGDGNAVAQTNGTALSTEAYVATDNFSIVHDRVNVRFFKNGVLKHTVAQAAAILFLKVSLRDIGSKLVNVRFGPSGSEGPQGPTGPGAKVLRLVANAQAFTYTGAGLPNPSSQTITFTVTRTNIASAPTFTTVPSGITLGGSGDTRTLTVANFGANNAVEVTASAEGFSDTVTIFRLTAGVAGQAAVSGFLTNESHTLAADRDGVVSAGALATATGLFKVFEGIADVSSSPTYSAVTVPSGVTVQINTADNTPVAGQPRGFYRVTAIAVDTASIVFRAVYAGVTIDKVFSVSKSRQGRVGRGSNLLQPEVWVVGTTNTQGTAETQIFAHQSNRADENQIFLGGAGGVPFGPFGNSQAIWGCLSFGETANTLDGGYLVQVPIDPRKSHRFVQWAYINGSTGEVQFRCAPGINFDLAGAPLSTGDFFKGPQASIPRFLFNRWYLFVGVVHGSSYSGGYSGQAGIYDKETGERIMDLPEFKHRPLASPQLEEFYFAKYNDPSRFGRMWLTDPRLEELDGSEPSILSILSADSQTGAFFGRNGVRVAGNMFIREAGGPAWNADAQSIQGYNGEVHCQFKVGHNNGLDVMGGFNSDPLTDANFTSLDAAWYAGNDGQARIYENGVQIAGAGTAIPLPVFTTTTEFGIARLNNGSGGFLFRYYMNKVAMRDSPNVTSARLYFDSSFFQVGVQMNSVRFGPGGMLEAIDTGDMGPNAATELATIVIASGQTPLLPDGFPVEGGQAPFTFIGTLVPPILQIPYIAELTVTMDAWRDIGTSEARAYIQLQGLNPFANLAFSQTQVIPATTAPGTRVVLQTTFAVPAARELRYFVVVENFGGGTPDIRVQHRNLTLKLVMIKR